MGRGICESTRKIGNMVTIYFYLRYYILTTTIVMEVLIDDSII